MLTGYWGSLDELQKVISKDYPDKYKGKEYYNLVKDICGAITQFGTASTSMQLVDEYKMDFLEHRKIIENLEASVLQEKCVFMLNFVVNVILRWQERGLFNSKYIN